MNNNDRRFAAKDHSSSLPSLDSQDTLSTESPRIMQQLHLSTTRNVSNVRVHGLAPTLGQFASQILQKKTKSIITFKRSTRNHKSSASFFQNTGANQTLYGTHSGLWQLPKTHCYAWILMIAGTGTGSSLLLFTFFCIASLPQCDQLVKTKRAVKHVTFEQLPIAAIHD